MNVVSCNSPARNQRAFGKKFPRLVWFALCVDNTLFFPFLTWKVIPQTLCSSLIYCCDQLTYLQNLILISLQDSLFFCHFVSSTVLINTRKFLLQILKLDSRCCVGSGLFGFSLCLWFLLLLLPYLPDYSCFCLAYSNQLLPYPCLTYASMMRIITFIKMAVKYHISFRLNFLSWPLC